MARAREAGGEWKKVRLKRHEESAHGVAGIATLLGMACAFHSEPWLISRHPISPERMRVHVGYLLYFEVSQEGVN